MTAPPFEHRPHAARSLAARWRHRADRIADLLDRAGAPPDDPARARVETLRLCADEVEPRADKQASP